MTSLETDLHKVAVALEDISKTLKRMEQRLKEALRTEDAESASEAMNRYLSSTIRDPKDKETAADFLVRAIEGEDPNE